MAPRKVADKTSSPQIKIHAKPVKKKEKKVKVEKPKLKIPSIIKLKVSSLKKLPCMPPEPPVQKEAKTIDAGVARLIELANEVAMAQFSSSKKLSFLSEINNPPSTEAKKLKVKIKKPKMPADKPEKPKKGHPKTKKEHPKTKKGHPNTKKVVSEYFKNLTPTSKKPAGDDDDSNVNVLAVIENSPPKKRIRKKKVNPDFENFDTTPVSYMEHKKKSTKKSTTTKRIRKPKNPKANTKKTDCVSKPRIRKPFKINAKLSTDTNTKAESPSLLDNDKMKCRETSMSSDLSWTKDISSSSSATCLTVPPNDIIKLDNRLPYVRLTSIENFLKPVRDKYCSKYEYHSTSGDSVTKSSLTSSPSTVSRSLNLSRSSSSSSTTSSSNPSNSPIKETDYENFDPKKLIDFDFLDAIEKSNFELNHRDRALINDPYWPEAARTIKKCCTAIKRFLQGDSLYDDVQGDIVLEPEKRAFEKSDKNFEVTEKTSQSTEKKSKAIIKTFNSENREANKVSITSGFNYNNNNNNIIDDNFKHPDMRFENEYRSYDQEMIALETEIANSIDYNTKEDYEKQKTYKSLQINNIKGDCKNITSKVTLNNDINGQKHNETDYAQAEKETGDYESFEDPFESLENDDKKEWYRPQNNIVTDDDDVLSLMAESITGLESFNMTDSAICTEPSNAEKCIPRQDPIKSINHKPIRFENNSPKTVRKDQNDDVISFNRKVNHENRMDNNNSQQKFSENPVNNQQTSAENQVSCQSFPNLRPKLLLSMYTMPPPVKCHFLRGVCYFNLTSNCRRQPCKFPHRSIDDAEALNRMSSCDNHTLIGDYLLIRNSPDLRITFGFCFACEFERRQMSRVLVEMVIDFTCRARVDKTEDNRLRVIITEKALEHLNELDLSMCADLLVYGISANDYLLCDKLMEVIAETQNFSRFKPVFLKLTDFMVGIYRMFNFHVACQILERLCILPCEPALIRAVWLIVMNTVDRIFQNPHMQQFEGLVCNSDQELYERLMSKKQQVMMDRDMVTGVPISQGGKHLAMQPELYMLATVDTDKLQQNLNRFDQTQNWKPPQTQMVIKNDQYTFTTPKIPKFKIPSTLKARQVTIEYQSPLQGNGKFNNYCGNGNHRIGYHQTMKNGAYNNTGKFLRRTVARPSDY